MERAFPTLHREHFDVVVIGAGINGASAIQHLASAGYRCLIVDKGDFASGASGRSSRMLHIGLRYFETPHPLLHFGLRPGRLVTAVRLARQAMAAVEEHLADAADRIWPYRMCFPIYRDDPVKRWHVAAGLRLLSLLGKGRVHLDPEMVDRDYASKIPFFDDLRDTGSVRAIACYREFKFDWPERFCLDMLLDAERNRAVLANYCTAELGERDGKDGWTVTLHSTGNPSLKPAFVHASLVLNMAGTWIDDILPSHRGRIVRGTKGAHIVVEMPERYRGFGIATLSRLNQPFYILPLHKNLYSVGVTETLFEGDATDVACSDDEIDYLIDETNHVLPGRALRRPDVLRSWAGVRPLTYSATEPMGTRTRELHDLAGRGFPGVFALTGGPIMTHRSSGRLVLDTVAKRLPPSAPPGRIDFAPYRFSTGENSPPLLADEPEVRVSDIEFGVLKEHAKSLTDVLLRRTGLAWRRNLTRSEAELAAGVVAPLLDWSKEEKRVQVEAFMAFQDTVFRRPPAAERSPDTFKPKKGA